MKKDLLAFCRYYNEESTNPYNYSQAWYVWAIEKNWVEEMLLNNTVSEYLSESLNHYISLGYSDFEMFDHTPITLKAMLYSLFEKWNEGIVTREEFSGFYIKWRDNKL